ncbi:hypothetical protein BUZ15_13210 [Staphylococcus gallinarum]|uniref:Csa1 family protein n=1 Tax=Staphylococcus gallinarum TaxID=1293 RepID=A0A2T4SU29_STAGA|nr:Csa1 family protein [Staphylococcus gallinarum]MCD8821030.1 tandem-type lipoprotein [Staphylococcus gallinarum]PTL08015.1 hypothetical protein BUZ15_13210 [Staphylococcus gallinarum]RIL26865.1 Csa1 family protein [Staphylococcus gallinarum]RIL42066.1 Csa1 family protein [Staphylococcus gallinarum]RIO73163.1 Csa1 family protein [Staphylococcus gallinarum]
MIHSFFEKNYYEIPTQYAPKLLLKGKGDFKDASIGSKDIKIPFIEKTKENIYFFDSITFSPSKNL